MANKQDTFLGTLAREETSENVANLAKFIRSVQKEEEDWLEKLKKHDAEIAASGDSLWVPVPPSEPETSSGSLFGSTYTPGASMNLAGVALYAVKPEFFKKIVHLMPKLLFAHSYVDHVGRVREIKTPLEIAIDVGDIDTIHWILSTPGKKELMWEADTEHGALPKHDMAYYKNYARQKAEGAKGIQEAIETAAKKAEQLPKPEKDYQWHVRNAENKANAYRIACSEEKLLEKGVETIKAILAEIKSFGPENLSGDQKVMLSSVDVTKPYDEYKMGLLNSVRKARYSKIIYHKNIDKVCSTLEHAITNREFAGVKSLFEDGGISSNVQLVQKNLRALREAEHMPWEDSKVRSFSAYIEKAKEMVKKAESIMHALENPVALEHTPGEEPYIENLPSAEPTKQADKAHTTKPLNTLYVTKQIYIQTLKKTFGSFGFDAEDEGIEAGIQRVIQDKYSNIEAQDKIWLLLSDIQKSLIAELEPKAEVVVQKEVKKTPAEDKTSEKVVSETSNTKLDNKPKGTQAAIDSQQSPETEAAAQNEVSKPSEILVEHAEPVIEQTDARALLKLACGASLGLVVGLSALYALRAGTAFPKDIAPSVGFVAAFTLAGGLASYWCSSLSPTSGQNERGE